MQGPGSTAIFPRILDRLLGGVIRIALKGESMRRRKSDEARLIPHRVAGVVENEWLGVQPVDATLARSLSAGVSYPNIFLGR
jgi:hypothetical protein